MENKRLLIEFQESNGNGLAELQVSAYPLEPGELEEILADLETMGFRFNMIDSTSVYATFEGSYENALATLKLLQGKGWKW